MSQLQTTGYTANAWKGNKRDAVQNMSLKDIAKTIKKEALKKYGDKIKLSVKTDHFANGCSIDATITAYAGGDVLSKEALEWQAGNQNSPFKTWLRDDPQLSKGYDWDAPYYSRELSKIIESIDEIGKSYNKEDCDSMIDYFNVDYYWGVDIEYDLYKKY